MATITATDIAQITGRTYYSSADIITLNTLLAVETLKDDTQLNAALREIDATRYWDLYDLASDIDICLSDAIGDHPLDLVVGINWLALSLKAAAQGHLV